MRASVIVSAVGDIAFSGESMHVVREVISPAARSCWAKSDLVIGNLEGPLFSAGNPVPGKCPLSSNPFWGAELAKLGITDVCIANNHMMDYGTEGLFNTLAELKDKGIRYFGAGRTKVEALAPVIVTIRGVRVALLGRSSVPVMSHCYATEAAPGVAWFDEKETQAAIAECRKAADLVILSMHWGIEHHRYPTPAQRALAKRLAGNGLHAILGHHPHVVQGIERIKNTVVAYSLGNCILDDFEWNFIDPAGKLGSRFIKMSDENRRGLIVDLGWKSGEPTVEVVPTRFSRFGTVEVDQLPDAGARLERLSWVLRLPVYQILWKIYAARMEWKLRLGPRIFSEGTLRKLGRVRMRHLKELGGLLHRSSRVARGKTTNPYD